MNNIKLIISILAITFLIGGCSTVPTDQVFFNDSGNTYLKDLCDRYQVQWEVDGITQVVTLSKNNKIASSMVGSNIVVIDSQEIQLDSSLESVNSAVIVGQDFEWKVMDRLSVRSGLSKSSTSRSYKSNSKQKIVIDAGHGGKDPGAIGHSGMQEKEVVLDIARRLKRVLEDQGMDVELTRRNDTFVSLKERTEIASRSKADLFVSIHANASTAKSASGFEVYSLRELEHEKFKEEQRLINHKHFTKKLAMNQNDHYLDNILEDLCYSHKQYESRRLADNVVKRVPKQLRARNRGVKEAQFYVLRNTLVPAVLIEVGFLSNPKEERLLKKKHYRQSLAHGIANSITEYINE